MSRLSNGSGITTTDETNITEQDISIKRASSTSSHYDNINANLHARVKAFQEQRALKRSASVGSSSSSTNSSKNNSSTNLKKHIDETNDNSSSIKTTTTTTHNDNNNEINDNNNNNNSTGTNIAVQAIKNRSRSHLKTQSAIETRSMMHSSSSSSSTIPHETITTNDNNSNNNSSSIINTSSSQSKHVSIVNKPLPPLPPVSGSTIISTTNTNTTKITQSMNKLSIDNNSNNNTTSIRRQSTNTSTNKNTNKPINKMTINTNLNKPNSNIATVPQQFNPNRRAPRRPVIITGANNTAAQNRQPKQSLSARRGLKLPPGGMSLKNLTKGASSSSSSSSANTTHEFEGSPTNEVGRRTHGSLINGVQRTSISSNDKTRGSNNEGSGSSSSGSGSGSGSGGLFSIFSKYVDIKSGSLNFAGKLSLSSTGIDFSNGSSSRITLDELEFIEELGHGNYGNVSKVLHKPTNVIMAMKEVKLELDEAKFKQILMELEILHKCQSPYIVDFYGAFFIEGAVYMCMEYMDGGSLDKIYDPSPEIGGIDEPQLAYITNAVIRGLKVLKDVHNIIHRDVKPTNILCSAKQGTIKLCDFGVSGNLVASMAKTNIGCQSYMAPERIKSLNPDIATYTVQSDIWSLGLSILEMALGRYPYPPETFDNIFSQLSAIVDGPAPKLPSDRFSPEAQEFVALCLQKIPERRPNYAALIEHPWLVKYRDVDVGMSNYITTRLQKRKEILAERGENGLPKVVPALHMGGLP